MRMRKAAGAFVTSAFLLAIVPSLGAGQLGQAPLKGAGAVVIHVRARGGGFLPERVREQARRVPNAGQVQSVLEGTTADGVRVIGVEPAPVLYLRSGDQALATTIIQGRGFERGDAPEAMVVGKIFAQKNKTALSLSIPAMLTKDHFPPIIVGGQGFAIVGIYATGDLKTDDQVLILLQTAQKLLNQPGRLSGLYVTPASSAGAETVVKDLRRILGDTVEVALLTRKETK